jgi:hypothetical protein
VCFTLDSINISLEGINFLSYELKAEEHSIIALTNKSSRSCSPSLTFPSINFLENLPLNDKHQREDILLILMKCKALLFPPYRGNPSSRFTTSSKSPFQQINDLIKVPSFRLGQQDYNEHCTSERVE